MYVYDLPDEDRRGTAPWLLTRLDHRGRRALRVILREVERECLARLVLLWTEEREPTRTTHVALAGDDIVLPLRLPRLDRSVPTREVVTDRVGDQHDAVLLRLTMGGGVPRLGLIVLDAEVGDAFDAIERAAEDVELAIVEALERGAANESLGFPLTPSRRGRHGRAGVET